MVVYNNNVTMCPLVTGDYFDGTKLSGMPAAILDGKHTGFNTRLLVQNIFCTVIFHYYTPSAVVLYIVIG